MLLAQDWQNFEVIVVDQLPQHNEKTKRYLEQIRDQIQYITSNNPNLPAARNAGVRTSSGRIVVFCDDDVQVPSSTLAQLVNSYNDPKVDGVSGFIIHETRPNGMVSRVSFEKQFRNHRNGARLIPVHDFTGGFMSFRREVFEQVGYFDEWIGTQPMAMGEDFEYCRRLHIAGRHLFLNPAISVLHEPKLDGGCGKTQFMLDEKEFQILGMRFYAYLKNRRNNGLSGFAFAIYRCYRSHVLNRSMFSLNPGFHYQRHRQFFRALRFALEAARQRNGLKPTLQ
jgi:glycosyltransferase involved in cell wall biosynthesis